MSDESDNRPLSTDPFAQGLTRDVVREYLRGRLQAVKGHPGVMGLAPFALESLTEGLARVVLQALDEYSARSEKPTDPMRPAAKDGQS